MKHTIELYLKEGEDVLYLKEGEDVFVRFNEGYILTYDQYKQWLNEEVARLKNIFKNRGLP